ncbi:D-alanyl-D-alanine carboxypeptidase-like protein [Krasilnikovia cinnamomea]|uniref:D-alanyl-D-alanine carboxypeptidase-like protein n=2 Tax=Krasilnikovia cinnamomea TaxID=349313 RepID=A0A4Q7ZTZ3_9ACTN|nr:D-alanyl-D-alanine carboxypeptidase-like protein [Krasilnikovia cinnamomea]
MATVLLLAGPAAAVATPAAAAAGPAAATPATAGPAAAGTARRSVWHVVAPGETMAGIAAANGLRVADVGRWNQIVPPYPVHVDETLRLTPPTSRMPSWRTRVEPVTPESVSWNPAYRCPVPPQDLRRIWVSYIDFRGEYHDGSIVMHKNLVTQTQQAFATLFRWRFRIMAMAPLWLNLPGQTDTSIATSGYACRRVAGSRVWSQHAYGVAIDLNPLQNPMVRGALLDPPAAGRWVRRNQYLIGMVHAEGAVRALTGNGFAWGGRWRTLKDYQHFSTTGR